MATVLDDLLKEVGGYVDQDAVTPTSTDLTLRVNYANRAIRRWESKYDWEDLVKTVGFTISGASFASISLPSDFVKPMGALHVWEDSTTGQTYPIINPDERFNYLESERVCFVMGNLSEGFTLRVPRGLASGASATMDYKMRASTFATTTDTVLIKDPNYITQSVIADVLESRGDGRFQNARFEAEVSLSDMVEAQNAGNKGKSNSIPISTGYVIGED